MKSAVKVGSILKKNSQKTDVTTLFGCQFNGFGLYDEQHDSSWSFKTIIKLLEFM